MMPTMDIKPFVCRADYELMVDYFLVADEAFLRGMGVDPAKLPTREAWLDRLLPDLDREDREKQAYYLGWLYDGVPIGHSNVNRIRYEEDAYIHLHSWNPHLRGAGLGTDFCRERSMYSSQVDADTDISEDAKPNVRGCALGKS
jgi:hypothetical protein